MTNEELSKKEFISRIEELSNKYPQNERIKKNLEYLKNGGYKEQIELIDKQEEVYHKLIIEYHTDLNLSFQKAYKNSINQLELIKIELDNIKSFLHGDLKSDLTIFDWTDIFQLSPRKAKEINRTLIKGLEIKNIFTGKIMPFEDFDNFAKVRALLFYENDLKKLLTSAQPIIKQNDKDDKKLSLKQIALIHVYEGGKITKENANKIASLFKHNSGHKLYQEYNKFYRRIDRKATTKTKKTMENKIKLFESILEFLHEPNKKEALDEINILKINYENEWL
ncbi:conserved hypothetical protein [Tenacibaculum maritimum]|uniref:hypothetical protein n=1 Tax=Tenacibaculum maritimum TaxID=107401 RepID=UPI0012E51A10|nr:hypothetical protein [Tenacibaculum maritimum]CAA0227696.1 conserved hypothetical protein [Tenacibaculum maritimum]